MTGDTPTIVIDVDVNGTEKIEEVAEATKKVGSAQRDVQKQNRKLGKAFKMLSGSLRSVDSGLGSLIGSFGKLAFAASPMFAAVSLAGIAIGAVTDALAKNREAIAFHREKYAEITETAAAARAEFADLTATILENGEVMRKYGIQFDGTIASMVSSIAGLQSAKFAANLKKNDAYLQTESDAYMVGGYDKLDERMAADNQVELQSKSFAKALSSLKYDYGAKFNPFGNRIPFLSDLIDSTGQFLGMKTEEQIQMGNVFREAGYRKGESQDEYRTRRIGEIEDQIQRNEAHIQRMVSEGLDAGGLKAENAKNQNLLEILRNGPRNANRAFSDSRTQATMLTMGFLHNMEKGKTVGNAEQIDETKKKIERAKKVDAILNPKGTTKSSKQVPDGVWDTNSKGHIKYGDLNTDEKKKTNINITNTIDVSGLDPNNVQALADAISKQFVDSLLPYVNSGGSMF